METYNCSDLVDGCVCINVKIKDAQENQNYKNVYEFIQKQNNENSLSFIHFMHNIVMFFTKTDVSKCIDYANDLHNKLNNMGITATIGVSEKNSEFNGIPTAYGQANKAIGVSVLLGRNKVVTFSEYQEIMKKNSSKKEIDWDEFSDAIINCRREEVLKYVSDYTEIIKAEKIPDEECVVFSVGGDGNLNEVLNGIAKSENKILGNIPTGSGNDFERTLSQYDDGIHDFDFGIINGRHFINVACVGLDADVANNISWIRKKKWIPVSQRYNASILYTFIKYKFKKVKVQIDDNQSFENQCTILAICNGQYYGGGFRMAPHATLDDGLFDVYFVEKMPKVKILPLFVKLLSAKHEKSPKIKKYQGEKVVIDSDKRYTFNVDGEMITDNHFEIEMRKNAVKVFCNKEFVERIIGK